jgi:hypothetical protein
MLSRWQWKEWHTWNHRRNNANFNYREGERSLYFIEKCSSHWIYLNFAGICAGKKREKRKGLRPKTYLTLMTSSTLPVSQWYPSLSLQHGCKPSVVFWPFLDPR